MATGADMHGENFEAGAWQKLFISSLRLVGTVLTAAFTAIFTNYLIRANLGGALAHYEQTVKQLATLALATPDPKQAPAWREKLADLARSKDEIEAELTRLDASFRAVKAEATTAAAVCLRPPRTGTRVSRCGS